MKVLITGTSRGIGKALFEIFKQNEFDVIGCSTTKDIICDVSDINQVKKMLPSDIDILINNAGIALYKQLQDTTEEDFNNIISVNIKGVFNCTKHVVPNMINNKFGIIYNVSSIWGEEGGSCESVYSASKGAIIAFSKALSKELEPSNIKVLYGCPNAVDTDMLKENPYGEVENAISAEEEAEKIFKEIVVQLH